MWALKKKMSDLSTGKYSKYSKYTLQLKKLTHVIFPLPRSKIKVEDGTAEKPAVFFLDEMGAVTFFPFYLFLWLFYHFPSPVQKLPPHHCLFTRADILTHRTQWAQNFLVILNCRHA